MHRIFLSRLFIVCCLTNFIVPNFAMAQNPTASGAHAQSTAKTKETPAEHQTDNTGFACTDIKNISKINITAFGIEISNLRARGIPGIAGRFNLFEVRYKISNNRDKKYGPAGNLFLALTGI